MKIKKKNRVIYNVENVRYNDFCKLDKNNIYYTRFFFEPNKYLFQKGNSFYIVKMNKEELANYDDKVIKFSYGSKLNNYNLEEIMFLNKFINIKLDGHIDCPTKNICYDDIIKLVNNVNKLKNDIIMNVIDKDAINVIKYIYDYYKLDTYYYHCYEHGYNMFGFDKSGNNFKNNCEIYGLHNSDMFGLINDKYATCTGLSIGLSNLYNYFGIESEVLYSGVHAICDIKLDDGHVSYIDFSKEISPDWQDSLLIRNGLFSNKRDVPICVRNNRQYNNFLKSRSGMGTFEKDDVSINIVDKNGELLCDLEPLILDDIFDKRKCVSNLVINSSVYKLLDNKVKQKVLIRG